MSTAENGMKTNELADWMLEEHKRIAALGDELGEKVKRPPKGEWGAWIADLCDALNLQPLSAFGIRRSNFPNIVEKSKNASSMKGNPVALTEEELTGILEEAMG